MKKLFINIGIIIPVLSICFFGFNLFGNNPKVQKNEACCIPQQNVNQSLYPVMNEPNPDFGYGLGTRFNNNLSLDQIRAAKTVNDLIPDNKGKIFHSFENVQVSVFGESGEITEASNGKMLSASQLALLKTLKYSSDFNIHAQCKRIIEGEENAIDYNLVYYITVVPEQQAEYIEGKEKLIEYLKSNSINRTSEIGKNELKSGMLHFVVSTEGSIENIRMASSCGLESLDDKMKELILSTSGQWKSAKNSKSEPVEQELVYFYGMIGC
ncbi:hypothetical protein HZR84_00735 [Hyphobacterium sp. CCMP332]|nr:hypothetical protein HZR84_00735 [Hyphobacterium sp. CCMP332]